MDLFNDGNVLKDVKIALLQQSLRFLPLSMTAAEGRSKARASHEAGETTYMAAYPPMPRQFREAEHVTFSLVTFR